MKKKLMLILSCLFLSIGFITAQTTRITGVVVDDMGEPVIGASVVVKGTTVGVATDVDGKFSINVPEGKTTLVFALVGLKTSEQSIASNMRVVMSEDSRILDEVVVTAMGISREKKALGYATQKLSTDDLTQASNSSLAGALQGKVSGVQITPSSGMPGSSSQIVIRGSRSFKGNNTPLYVVDGMPIASTADENTDTKGSGSISGTDYANRAVDIDPNDIESIEILKGQAASALYGIRASNGVIIITTKSGKTLKKGKVHISLSSSVSFDQISRYPDMQTKYAQGSAGKYSPSSSSSWGPLIKDLPNDATYGGNTSNANTANGTQLVPGKYYVPQRAQAGLDPWATPGVYNNIKDFFDTGVTWNNSANLAQALDRASYTVSLSTSSQDGIVPETGMDRYTAKVGADTKLSDLWSTGFVGTYVNTSINKMPSANSGLVATVFGASPTYDLAGIPYHAAGNPYTQVNYRGGSFENPYWAVNNNEFTEKTSRFYGNTYVNYATNLNSLDKKLNLKYQFGVDSYTTNYTDSWGYGSKQATTGQIENYSWTNLAFNSLLNANFNWKINEDWALDALLGNEIIHENKKYYYQYGVNYNFSGWNHIQNATTTANENKYLSKRTVGFFGSVSASYRNMLYFGVTGREDIVSGMPRDNRSFFYPSISSSFVLTELDGVKSEFLDFAKIRASYAEVGQAAEEYLQNYFYVPGYGGGFYSGNPIMYPINAVNGFTPYYKVYDPKLKPQNTRSYELGFDATLFKGLFDISYTYSRQDVKDQIFDVPLAGSTGIQSIITNAGKVHTNAHEITLNVNPVRTHLVDWSFGVNWSKIDNYVDELAAGVESIMLGGFTTPQVRAGVGDKFPVIYGVDYKRDTQGRILVDEDGMPMAGEDAVIGKVAPDFNLGFNTAIRIEKLKISAVFDWKCGGQMYHGTNALLDVYGVSQKTANRDTPFIFDGWKEDGTKNDIAITNHQAFYNTVSNISAYYIYDNSFIKLRELSLSYPVFKNSWTDVTLNAFARNILIWTELPNFDPESTQGNNSMAGAFERFSLPQTSSYGFGVNVKF